MRSARGSRPVARAAAILAVALGASLALAPAAPGAFSLTFTVDTTADGNDATPGDFSCDDGSTHCTLRAAIQEANATSIQDTVVVPPGTYKLSVGPPPNQLVVTSDVIVDGTGTAANTIVTPMNGVGRNVDVKNTGTLDMRDITLTGATLAAEGAGIRNAGKLTMRRTVVSDNEAIGSDGGGVGIISPATETTILDSTIGSADGGATPGNRAGAGAGATAYGGGIKHESGTLTLRNTTVAHNTATASNAGGSASADGGGIYSDYPLTIEDSKIASNVAMVAAGATGGLRRSWRVG